jgi:hypothetical protein
MGAPYTSVAISNYNANPPADDGSEVPANRVDWSKHKEKLGDPLKTAVEAINTNITSAFGKVWGGGGVTNTAISYGISASDQGKLVRATASGITLTTPAAATVTSPFVCAILNNSSGTITVDGNDTETIDGSASITLGAGQGCFLVTDGTNWYTAGLGAIPAGNQIGYGQIINGTLAEANATNAVTFSVKTLAGNTPSATDPVIIAFRNATAATGNYVYRAITSACELTIPSTATMGASNGAAFRLWIVVFDDGGTLRLGAINCVSGANIYPLGRSPIQSSTTIGTGADSAQVFYSSTGVTSKPYVIFGYASYEGGLATAGTWNVSPTVIQLQGPSDPLPGHLIQRVQTVSGAVATGLTATVSDDTIPQSNEGNEFMTRAITPASAANLLRVAHRGNYSNSTSNTAAVFILRDSGGDALAAHHVAIDSAAPIVVPIETWQLAGSTSATTFKVNAGCPTGTITFNGVAGSRVYGGVIASQLEVEEFMG